MSDAYEAESGFGFMNRHGYEAASQEAEAEAKALATLETKAEATASQRLRSQNRSL